MDRIKWCHFIWKMISWLGFPFFYWARSSIALSIITKLLIRLHKTSYNLPDPKLVIVLFSNKALYMQIKYKKSKQRNSYMYLAYHWFIELSAMKHRPNLNKVYILPKFHSAQVSMIKAPWSAQNESHTVNFILAWYG